MKRLVTSVAVATALLPSGASAAAGFRPNAEPPPSPPSVASGAPAPGDRGGLPGSLLQHVLSRIGLWPPPPGEAVPEPAPPPPDGGLGPVATEERPPAHFRFPPLSVAGGPPQGALAGLTAGSFAGYGSGTVFHADAALSGRDRRTDVELGFSGAVFSSAALPARTNELRRPLSPSLQPATGYGVGNAVEIGFNRPPEEAGQLELDDRSEAKAPPSGEPVTKRLTRVKLDPVTDADVLRSSASARAAGAGCVVGADLAYGLAELTDTRLVKQSEEAGLVETNADGPARGTSRSISRTRLTTLPGRPLGLFGLLSETRQTIAPITVLEGTPQEFTVELAGEWVLRVMADGRDGTVTFGPDVEEPDQPLLRVFDKDGDVVDQLTLRAFMEKEGAAIEVADGALITIGEDPRAIGGDELSRPLATGTLTAAAADVVRIQVATGEGPDSAVAELRVGHMEAGVAVPAGGVRCPGIGMVKESDPPAVKAGDRFDWTITVSNPNDCVLDSLKVTDTITATPGIGYRILSTSPEAARGDGGSTLTFDNVGPIPFGGFRTLIIRVQVDDDAPGGRFTDEAVATGTCGPASLAGDAGVDIPVQAAMQGRVVLQAPEVVQVLGASAVAGPAEILPRAAPPALPATGGHLVGILPALALLAAGRLLRRKRGSAPELA